jgi:pimeloyl-ACP methyl ester carboxylesterase
LRPRWRIQSIASSSTAPALNKLIAKKISGTKYVELPGCGHCPPLEQPKEFLAAIKEFVDL